MSNRRWKSAIPVIAFAFAAPLTAQDWRKDYDRVKLFTERQPMIVGGMRTTDEIETMVENRLRDAGLLLEEGFLEGPDVWLDIDTFSGEQPHLRFQKMLNDPASGSRGAATTFDSFWDQHHFPVTQTGRDSRAVVSDLLDAFIVEYLRVNEGSC